MPCFRYVLLTFFAWSVVDQVRTINYISIKLFFSHIYAEMELCFCRLNICEELLHSDINCMQYMTKYSKGYIERGLVSISYLEARLCKMCILKIMSMYLMAIPIIKIVFCPCNAFRLCDFSHTYLIMYILSCQGKKKYYNLSSNQTAQLKK
jgi:hypothetical protein